MADTICPPGRAIRTRIRSPTRPASMQVTGTVILIPPSSQIREAFCPTLIAVTGNEASCSCARACPSRVCLDVDGFTGNPGARTTNGKHSPGRAHRKKKILLLSAGSQVSRTILNFAEPAVPAGFELDCAWTLLAELPSDSKLKLCPLQVTDPVTAAAKIAVFRRFCTRG